MPRQRNNRAHTQRRICARFREESLGCNERRKEDASRKDTAHLPTSIYCDQRDCICRRSIHTLYHDLIGPRRESITGVFSLHGVVRISLSLARARSFFPRDRAGMRQRQVTTVNAPITANAKELSLPVYGTRGRSVSRIHGREHPC